MRIATFLKFSDVFLSGVCCLCGDKGHQSQDICSLCLDDLPLNSRCCCRCALPLSDSPGRVSDAGLCGRCLKKTPSFDALLAPYLYEAPCDFLVKRLKFGGKLYLGRLMGVLLARHVSSRAVPLPDVILPTPLHSARFRQRGFNQSEQIAREIGAQLRCKVDSSVLMRTQNTLTQMALPAKQRKNNVRNAFAIRGSLNAKKVAIVDDVTTTSATVNEISRVVKRAGAAHVQVWSFARAASHGLSANEC